jgi:hypothetical protein
MDPFQTNYFSENLVAPGIKPSTSGSVARNSDHWTTEAVYLFISRTSNQAIGVEGGRKGW